jgi:hypothetical protein
MLAAWQAAGHRSIWIIQFALKLVVNARAINGLDIFPVKISIFTCFLTEYIVFYIQTFCLFLFMVLYRG